LKLGIGSKSNRTPRITIKVEDLTVDELSDEIRKAARNLEENRYTKTSKLIISLAKMLEKEKDGPEREDFVRRIGPLFDIFKNEFAVSCPVGQNYRRRCFEEVTKIVLKAFGGANDPNNELLTETNRFMDQMHEVKQSIEPMMDLFMSLFAKPDRSNQESLIMFHSACQSYLTGVEGVFGELAKTVYFFIEVLGDSNSKLEDIKGANVWAILRGCKQIFGFSPVFLENWQEKNDIRNAIAHAQAQYYPAENKVHFSSADSKSSRIYDRTMTFEEFLAIELELIDAIDSFYYAIELVRVMRLLTLAYARHSRSSSS
jgi:hypothetical protein